MEMLLARVWHMVSKAAPVGSWASVGGREEWLALGVQLGPTRQGPHITPQQLNGMGQATWEPGAGVVTTSPQTSWECWAHILHQQSPKAGLSTRA